MFVDQITAQGQVTDVGIDLADDQCAQGLLGGIDRPQLEFRMVTSQELFADVAFLDRHPLAGKIGYARNQRCILAREDDEWKHQVGLGELEVFPTLRRWRQGRQHIDLGVLGAVDHRLPVQIGHMLHLDVEHLPDATHELGRYPAILAIFGDEFDRLPRRVDTQPQFRVLGQPLAFLVAQVEPGRYIAGRRSCHRDRYPLAHDAQLLGLGNRRQRLVHDRRQLGPITAHREALTVFVQLVRAGHLEVGDTVLAGEVDIDTQYAHIGVRLAGRDCAQSVQRRGHHHRVHARVLTQHALSR